MPRLQGGSPLRQPVDVCVHRERGNVVALRHHNRRCLVPNTWQLFQLLKGFGNHATVDIHQHLCCFDEIFRLRGSQAHLFDQAFYNLWILCSHSFCTRSLSKERRRHLVYLLISCLHKVNHVTINARQMYMTLHCCSTSLLLPYALHPERFDMAKMQQ